jgi:hypothetical protein
MMEVSNLGRSISSILESGSHLHSEKERQGKILGIRRSRLLKEMHMLSYRVIFSVP